MLKNAVFLLFLITISWCSAQNRICSYQNGNVTANWRIFNNALQIQYQNRGVSINKWTAIGFGPSMQNLDVVVFENNDGRVQIRTGRTTGYSAPTFDSQNNLNVQYQNLKDSTLNAVIFLPLQLNSNRLEQCQTWNFVNNGEIVNGQLQIHNGRPDQLENVCASQCS